MKEFYDIENDEFHSKRFPNKSEYEFKVYVLESYTEAGFSSRAEVIGYFSTKEKAIDYLNSNTVKGQVSIYPIFVK